MYFYLMIWWQKIKPCIFTVDKFIWLSSWYLQSQMAFDVRSKNEIIVFGFLGIKNPTGHINIYFLFRIKLVWFLGSKKKNPSETYTFCPFKVYDVPNVLKNQFDFDWYFNIFNILKITTNFFFCYFSIRGTRGIRGKLQIWL
jgi:hypothetical protein